MQKRLVFYYIAQVLLICSFCMATSLLWDINKNASILEIKAFAFSILLAWIISIPTLILLKKHKQSFESITVKDGIGIVSLTWIGISLWGALPFFLSQATASYTDAVFETVSGLTTTGSSIFTDVEILPRGILFWRSLTHWLGGLGVIVLFVALVPNIGTVSSTLSKMETTGIDTDKIRAKMKDSAVIIWEIYILLTVLSIGILMYLGMPLFDAICHAFGAIGTGGFSTKNSSIAAYNSNIQWAIIVIMILGGINFSLYYFLFSGKLKKFFQNEEFRLYSFLLLTSSLFVALILKINNSSSSFLRDSIFQVVSLMTATGYATADFDLWPEGTKILLLILMFIGGCAGSTSGGLKVVRLLLSIKVVFLSIKKIIYPQMVQAVNLNRIGIPSNVLERLMLYFAIYLGLWASGSILLALTESCSMLTAVSASISALSSVGPGLEAVGPTQNYGWMTPLGKWTLIFLMFAGRLEFYTFISLFFPIIWKRA